MSFDIQIDLAVFEFYSKQPPIEALTTSPSAYMQGNKWQSADVLGGSDFGRKTPPTSIFSDTSPIDKLHYDMCQKGNLRFHSG